MADFPFSGQMVLSEVISSPATSTGLGVTRSSGSAGAYGPWRELIASTARATDLIILQLGFTSTGYLSPVNLQLAVGAAASEEVIVDTIHMHSKRHAHVENVSLPIHIAEGERLSARVAIGHTGSDSVYLGAQLYAASFPSQKGFSKTVSIGLSTLTPTAVDPGGTEDTKGSYVELTSSVPVDLKGFYLQVRCAEDQPADDADWLIDVAVGAAASEVNLIEDYYFVVEEAGFISTYPGPGAGSRMQYFPIAIPAGERLSARAQCSTNNATDRIVSVCLMGIY